MNDQKPFNAGGPGGGPVAEKDPDHDTVIGDMGRDYLSRIDIEEDRARLKVGAALLNTFNFAIQEQSGRKEWNELDFHRFIRAYVAIDGIGRIGET